MDVVTLRLGVMSDWSRAQGEGSVHDGAAQRTAALHSRSFQHADGEAAIDHATRRGVVVVVVVVDSKTMTTGRDGGTKTQNVVVTVCFLFFS